VLNSAYADCSVGGRPSPGACGNKPVLLLGFISTVLGAVSKDWLLVMSKFEDDGVDGAMEEGM